MSTAQHSAGSHSAARVITYLNGEKAPATLTTEQKSSKGDK